uniref:MI domain-containing protein n=1 Tax=Branchiostoma floridae TaxID=7739 RepID=C3YBY3_BRAFL|eukprot:XP_002606148.1 hypothetical protein BRAFLDRAFT_126479 [Branchiostoma floridae]
MLAQFFFCIIALDDLEQGEDDSDDDDIEIDDSDENMEDVDEDFSDNENDIEEGSESNDEETIVTNSGSAKTQSSAKSMKSDILGATKVSKKEQKGKRKGVSLNDQNDSKTVKQKDTSTDEDDADEDKSPEKRKEKSDIYGGAVARYIPPHERLQPPGDDEKRKVTLERLRKQVKGLINRLSEGNMHSIGKQFESLYASNSRNDMNDLVTSVLTEACLSPDPLPERLMMEHCMLVALLHNNIGAELGAHLVEFLARRFDRLHRANENRGEGKECDNVVAMFAHLYNFKVTLLVWSRVKFMLETIAALRNNNMKKMPNYDPAHLDHLQKLLRGMLRNKGSISDTQLRIPLEDLLSVEEKGRWWVVGSAWTGRGPGKGEDGGEDDDEEEDMEDIGDLHKALDDLEQGEEDSDDEDIEVDDSDENMEDVDDADDYSDNEDDIEEGSESNDEETILPDSVKTLASAMSKKSDIQDATKVSKKEKKGKRKGVSLNDQSDAKTIKQTGTFTDEDDADKDKSLEKRKEKSDIYGGAVARYIPPHERLQPPGDDEKRKVTLERLRKQVKGLINRLSEGNMHSIGKQFESLYASNSRNDVGFLIRKDNPAALKDVIQLISTKSAAASQDFREQSRVKFMLETIAALRNNNMKKMPNYDPAHLDHLQKLLRGMLRNKGSISDTQLRIPLEDLLSVEEKGRWWVVGSAWTGRGPGKGEDGGEGPAVKGEMSEKISELARKQRMNTDLRKNIFAVVMTSEDYMDAFEKLLQLQLKKSQEPDIIHVLLDCTMQERGYNPYYSYLAQKFCDFDRRFMMTIQFSLWDRFAVIDSLSSQNSSNLAQLVAHLLVTMAIPLSVLKKFEFAALEKPTVQFLRQILLALLLEPEENTVQAMFSRVAKFPKLQQFRDGLRLFMSHFLMKKKSKMGDEIAQKLRTRLRMAERALLSTGSKTAV